MTRRGRSGRTSRAKAGAESSRTKTTAIFDSSPPETKHSSGIGQRSRSYRVSERIGYIGVWVVAIACALVIVVAVVTGLFVGVEMLVSGALW